MEQATPATSMSGGVGGRALPDGKKLIPGVVTHHTKWSSIRAGRAAAGPARQRRRQGATSSPGPTADLRRERSSTGCHPETQWAKLDALAEGARIASKELWGAAATGLASPATARRRPPAASAAERLEDVGGLVVEFSQTAQPAACRLVDVVLAGGRHRVLVPGLGGADDVSDLGHGAGTAARLRERSRPQEPDASPQAVERLADRLVPGAVEQDVVEVVLRRQHLLDVGAPMLGEPLDLPERSAQLLDLVIGGAADEPAAGERLERGSHLVQVGRLLGGGHDDDRALLGNRRHQSLGGELAQHLADRGPRDARLLDQLALDQPLAGLQAEIEDRLTQHVEHLLAKRRGHPADPHRQIAVTTT